MGYDLYWSLPPSETKEHSLDLKWEIGKYFDDDYNGEKGEWEADRSLIPFLKGIIACGSPEKRQEAIELLENINQYGKLILSIHG